ncbi:MAG: hypothetical protein V1839_01895, partial [archaeon]
MPAIVRNCSVCGDEMKINVDKKGHYDKGYYLSMKEPVEGTGRYKKAGTIRILDKKYPVIKWTGKEKTGHEYWECGLCYDAAVREDWLEERIESMYGTRCPDFDP